MAFALKGPTRQGVAKVPTVRLWLMPPFVAVGPPLIFVWEGGLALMLRSATREGSPRHLETRLLGRASRCKGIFYFRCARKRVQTWYQQQCIMNQHSAIRTHGGTNDILTLAYLEAMSPSYAEFKPDIRPSHVVQIYKCFKQMHKYLIQMHDITINRRIRH